MVSWYGLICHRGIFAESVNCRLQVIVSPYLKQPKPLPMLTLGLKVMFKPKL